MKMIDAKKIMSQSTKKTQFKLAVDVTDLETNDEVTSIIKYLVVESSVWKVYNSLTNCSSHNSLFFYVNQ